MKFQHPTAQDGAAIWTIVRDSGVLDLNSSYCYLMMGQYFSRSCIIARDEATATVAGFIIGFRPPEDQQTLFVWQVAVSRDFQGQGIATRMLMHLLASQPQDEVRFIEATISPSNTASQALFIGAAGKLAAEYSVADLFPAEWFPGGGVHEPEQRYRIGPFTTIPESVLGGHK
ncbi:MAG: diaminobutyrate acetyltransferase [Spirochaeta sp.]